MTKTLLFAIGIFAVYARSQAVSGCAPPYGCADFPGDAFPTTPVPATSVSIGNPTGLAIDSAGNLYIAGPSIVFKVDPAGMITRVAGNGHYGFAGDGGPATEALLGFPRASTCYICDSWDVTGSLAVDASGNLFIADFFNSRIREVTPDGQISTVAGTPDSSGNFPLVFPAGVAVDSFGTLYAAAYGGISQISGNGIVPLIGYNCLQPGNPGVCLPAGIAVDLQGNVYVAELSCRVQRRGLDGTITTVAGATALVGFLYPCDNRGNDLSDPYGVAVDNSGNVFIADTYNNVIKRIDPDGNLTIVAGSGQLYKQYSGDGGPAIDAKLSYPHAVAADNAGNLYIADTENFVVRKVTPDGLIQTVAGNGLFWGGNISATSNPCDLSGNLLCTAYINWTTSKRVARGDTYITTGISNAQVWVRMNDGPETPFASGAFCSYNNCPAPWIQGSPNVYTFSLYDCDDSICTDTDHGTAKLLAFVVVTAQ